MLIEASGGHRFEFVDQLEISQRFRHRTPRHRAQRYRRTGRNPRRRTKGSEETPKSSAPPSPAAVTGVPRRAGDGPTALEFGDLDADHWIVR
jgi:hypothetical protein